MRGRGGEQRGHQNGREQRCRRQRGGIEQLHGKPHVSLVPARSKLRQHSPATLAAAKSLAGAVAANESHQASPVTHQRSQPMRQRPTRSKTEFDRPERMPTPGWRPHPRATGRCRCCGTWRARSSCRSSLSKHARMNSRSRRSKQSARPSAHTYPWADWPRRRRRSWPAPMPWWAAG